MRIREASGGACGMVGFGVPFPWFDPGLVYTTPDVAGLRFSLGVYDPATIDNARLVRTPLPRFAGEVKFDCEEILHVFASGFWQTLAGTVQETNGASSALVARDLHTEAWGAEVGGMFSVGPVMIGGAAYQGTGYSPLALQSQLSADGTGAMRTSRGAFGMGALSVDGFRLKIAGGLGVWHLDETKNDAEARDASGNRTNGVASATNPAVTAGVVTPKQIVSFVNAGMTVAW
ncbi:MAG: hypothetical protein M3O36_03650 [Myxococcota bacterium]|nr:hypothetical protein [Myxococcota bacterium]